MPFPATPSPFRLSRRQTSTRRGAGPQFAHSPRFVFSHSTSREADKDSYINDDDFPPSTAPVASTSGTQQRVFPRHSQRDVIVDYDDGDLRRNTSTQRKSNNPVYDIIDSTPPEPPETPGIPYADYHKGSEYVQDSNKRRRTLGRDQSPSQKLEQAIGDASASLLDRPHDVTVPPATPAPNPPPDIVQRDSTTKPMAGVPVRPAADFESLTPTSSKPPFRSKPRFILSSQKPPSSQPTFRVETPAASYPTSTPAEKRKPTFVLPPSPSPKKVEDDIPAPFSPSSRTLRRRGRPRSGTAGYAPGGMAAEVRSWVLDMGSKHEQSIQTRSDLDGNTKDSDQFRQYLLAARVITVRQTTLSSSGPLAFIQVERVEDSWIKDDDSNILHILAMGAPRSKPQSYSRPSHSQIQAGDLLGFHRGLAWDVDLYHPGEYENVEGSQVALDDTGHIQNPKQRWLVAMEWDLIKEAT